VVLVGIDSLVPPAANLATGNAPAYDGARATVRLASL
jgi:hypothetical protein